MCVFHLIKLCVLVDYHYSIEKKNIMTLVYRAPKLVEKRVEDTPGPTTYSLAQISKNKVASSSCFLSKIERNLKIVDEEIKAGPGSYFKEGEEVKKMAPSAVFQSKIERFQKQKVSEKKKDMSQLEQDQADGDSKGEPYKIPGKLLNTKDRKAFQKDICPQRLPSIPTNEHAYGYRYDAASNKLVYNDSPKIMFAKKLTVLDEDNFYFQRTQQSLGKGQKCNFMGTVKRSSPELQHQIDLPNSTQYDPDKYMSIGNHKKSKTNGCFVGQGGRTEEMCSTKDTLLLNKLKSQFRGYMTDDVDLQKLREQKTMKEMVRESFCGSRHSPPKKEFFMVKENRFKGVNKENKGQVVQENIEIGMKQEHTEGKEQQIVETKKKQPFALGEQRWKQRMRQKLGPGSYDCPKQENKAVSLIQNEQRFKAVDSNFNTPGPGAYQAFSVAKPEKQKIFFARFVCRKEQKDENKFGSMEDLYQQVGRHMNYLNKIEKSETMGKNSSQDSFRREKQNIVASMAKVKAKIKEKIGRVEGKDVAEQNRLVLNGLDNQRSVHPKYIHMYEYSRPDPPEKRTGPGCYQIAGSLEKKSFNKSPPPVY